MLLSLALVSALAAPLSDAPPVEAATTPAPAPAPAPAAEPIVIAPATEPVVIAPAPAPTEAAPTTTVVVTTTTTTTSAPIVVQTAPAPVVVTQPPPPVLSPPSPTWGPVQPTPAARPDPARALQAMRAHRRSAIGVFTVGSLGLAGALGLQYARARMLQRCLDHGYQGSHSCTDAEAMEAPLGNYSAIGMAMFVTGTAGAGVMFGNAAATRDVQLRNGDARSRGGAKLLGVLAIGAASAWMIGANYSLLRREAGCDGDPRCLAKYRPLRWAANDVATLGIGAGAGLLGWGIAYERQGKALMKLRAAPSMSARHTGLAVSMSF